MSFLKSKEKRDPLLGILDRWNCRATVEMLSIMDNCSMDEVSKKVFLNGLRARYGDFVDATQPKPQQTVRVAEVQPMQPQRPMPAQKIAPPVKEVQPVQTDLFQKEKKIRPNVPSGCIRLYNNPVHSRYYIVISAYDGRALRELDMKHYQLNYSYKGEPAIAFSKKPLPKSRPLRKWKGGNTIKIQDKGFIEFVKNYFHLDLPIDKTSLVDIKFTRERETAHYNNICFFYWLKEIKK